MASQSETSSSILNVSHDDDVRSITTSLSGSTTTEIGQEQIDHIRDAFAVFDKEMTGSITTEQFRYWNLRINKCISIDFFFFFKVKFSMILDTMFLKRN